jgi:peptide deformylase
MTVRPIVQYPDARLRQPTVPVSAFDDSLRELAADLLDSMKAAQGIGITAPHIGVLQRVMVIQLTEDESPRTYVNPKVVWSSVEKSRNDEGSISMSDAGAEVERPAKVRITYQDLDGKEHEEEADGLLAVCHQHEIDQLDGIFWIQKLSPLRRERVVKRHEKIQKLRRTAAAVQAAAAQDEK